MSDPLDNKRKGTSASERAWRGHGVNGGDGNQRGVGRLEDLGLVSIGWQVELAPVAADTAAVIDCNLIHASSLEIAIRTLFLYSEVCVDFMASV